MSTVNQAIVETSALGTAPIVHLSGVEGMNELPAWTVVVEIARGDVDLEAALGASAAVVFADDDGWLRQLDLVVIDIAYVGASRRGHRYDLTLSAGAWILGQRVGCRIFQKLGANEIVQQVLDEAGIPSSQSEWRQAEPLHQREQCVQYAESDWDFVQRLLADEGINYWLDTNDGESLLVFGDHPGAHELIDGDGTMRFEDGGGLGRSASSLHAFERGLRMTHEAVYLVDDDVDRPDVPIEGRAGGGPLEYYEYPAWMPDAATAQRRATVRLEQQQRLRQWARAESHSARLVPGRTVRVEGLADGSLEGTYLVVRVEHDLMQSADESEPRHYSCSALLVPHGGAGYHRPAPPGSVPRIDGLESAVITGPAGETVHVDELGRVKLRFPWDRSGIADDGSSCWTRSLQLDLDGSMMLPRIGWEVSVAYRDGCLDHPLVLAKLYNAAATVPYPLPESKATASLMSGTVPGDGSVNELRLSDDAGKQQFAVQASGDQSLTIGGTLTTMVTANEKYNVKGNITETIEGSQTVSVGGNQTITVGSGCMTKVGGARSVTVGGMEKIGVDLDRVLDCGSTYAEVVGGLYFIRCNQAADTLKADLMNTVGGAVTIAAGGGVNESVVGTRNEVCGGPRVIDAAMYEDKAYGVKTLTCGASTLTAGADVLTKVKASAVVSAGVVSLSGSSIVLLDGGENVTINAATLTASAGYSMAGVHSCPGDVDLDNSTLASKSLTKASG